MKRIILAGGQKKRPGCMQSSGKPGIRGKAKVIYGNKKELGMKYCEFEELISPQRIGRYYNSCNQHVLKTISLYHANIRLSQAFLPILSYFEVVLRNRIDLHYRLRYVQSAGKPDWLIAAALPGGFFAKGGCLSSSEKILQAHARLGSRYTHDRLVAELSFGFWRFMFAGKQYQAAGNTTGSPITNPFVSELAARLVHLMPELIFRR
jgi:hypothetical protein